MAGPEAERGQCLRDETQPPELVRSIVSKSQSVHLCWSMAGTLLAVCTGDLLLSRPGGSCQTSILSLSQQRGHAPWSVHSQGSTEGTEAKITRNEQTCSFAAFAAFYFARISIYHDVSSTKDFHSTHSGRIAHEPFPTEIFFAHLQFSFPVS